MNQLKVSSLGPIKEADITFGDLTIMVGPQASGKSILLQLLKLIVDKTNIRSKIEQYGFVWGKSEADILNRYFGEGMAGIWNDETKIVFNGKEMPLNFVLPKDGEMPSFIREQYLFYIPAQRIICLQNGWPRFFTDYEDSVPFVLREFSETIRLYVEENMSTHLNLAYAYNKGLNGQVKESFDESIFHQAELRIDTIGKKRFKLDIGNSSIPFMVWSAGQKEFMPLLLSFYYLCPFDELGSRSITQTVIIEEPEMGLHPKAIKSVLLQILDLMQRGYEVILSTHSPVLLEFAWTLTNLQKNEAGYHDLAELFGLKSHLSTDIINMLTHALKSNVKTYFFDRNKKNVIVRDISSLDAGSDDEAVAEWGGLTSFGSKAVDIVSNTVSHE